MKKNKAYTIPKLKKNKLKWYVEYSLYDPASDKMVRKRDYEGLNIKGTPDRERIKIADARIKAIIRFHETIGNPLDKPAKAPNKTIREIMDDLIKLKSKDLRPRSLTHYTQGKRVFEEYGYTHLKPEQFTEEMAQGFSDFLMVDKGYSPKTHNNHLQSLITFFKMMKKRKMIDSNPFEDVKKKKKTAGRILFYDQNKKKAIKKYLTDNDHPLLMFVQFEFYCFIRPKELMELQVKHIDFTNSTISIPAHIAKNGKYGVVPIKEEFMKRVRKRYSGLEPELYLFGRGLVPHLEPLHRNRASASHANMLKDLNISNEYHLYDWKHTGGREFVLSGRNVYDLMRLMRHGSLEQTMQYLASLGLTTEIVPDPKAWIF